MHTFTTSGAALAYDVDGADGPLVVQLHGLTSGRARDRQLGLDLSRALRGHRVLRYDARGHAESSGTADPDTYRWERLADDLLALLDHVAPGEAVHGVGPSMGTGTLLHAVTRDPARFASLTFVTPPTAGRLRREQAETYLTNAELVEREGLDAFLALDAVSPAVPAMGHAPETLPTVPALLMPSVLRGAAASDFPHRRLIIRIQTPTLILAWTGDKTHPMATAKRLHKAIHGSRLEVARTPYGVVAWPGLFAEHVVTSTRR
ncbi:alpha/beta hydrolase [Aeromicrobium alkaliterrae]|uniref:Alpha/beta hydrolase n=1 Tax=Aeromicrobium alkaliterrae TaxID=302168 RepID=A0ABN2JT29_9ACTN